MIPELQIPSPIQKLADPLFASQGLEVWIKRDDLIHPHISGNKWRKLKYNILEAKRQNKSGLLTFGGAYSNHIQALAAAAKMVGLKSLGLIRGDEPRSLNANLEFAQSQGMGLRFLDRSSYRQKQIPEDLQSLNETWYLVPEGGSNTLALPGVGEMLQEIEQDFDFFCCACGTGGTLAGVVRQLPESAHALGFSALKRGGFLREEVLGLLGNSLAAEKFHIETRFHFGGYAKTNAELLDFIRDFQDRQGIPLDFVYTGKMLFGVYELVREGYFPEGSRIILYHSGGVANAGVSSGAFDH